MIRDQLLTPGGDLRPGWAIGDDQGQNAETYLSAEFVIQRRPGYFWNEWQGIRNYLQGIDDPDELLLASRGEMELRDREIWIRMPRYRPIDHAGDLLPGFRRSLGEVLETEALLARQPLDPEMFRFRPSKGTALKYYDPDVIALMTEAKGREISWPRVDLGPLVLSHGDLLAKNIVWTPIGYRLIDWESFAPYPEGTSIYHLFAWMISKLDDASGLEFLETYRPRIAEYLPRVAENLALGTAWALAREAVYWKTRESFDELLDQAESLIPGA